MPTQRRPAVFLDRDGVIIKNRDDYVRSWRDVAFIPGALEALRHLGSSPYAVVVVTNQSPVGRGLLSMAEAEAINERVIARIEDVGGRVDASYLCPHRPDELCACRKPAPGMLLRAATELTLDLPRSYLIGDALSDMAAADAAGARGVLVLTGRGAAQAAEVRARYGAAVPMAADLAEALRQLALPTRMGVA